MPGKRSWEDETDLEVLRGEIYRLEDALRKANKKPKTTAAAKGAAADNGPPSAALVEKIRVAVGKAMLKAVSGLPPAAR
jgi:hypothetical protein